MNTDLTFRYPHPPTTEEALAAFEKELGFRLPEDYRQFLLKYNGGGLPTNSCFSYKLSNGKSTVSSVAWLYGLDVDTHAKLRVNNGGEDKPKHLLIIGQVGGSLLGIGICDESIWEVYLWEHTVEGDVILVANSFNEFLDMLYDNES